MCIYGLNSPLKCSFKNILKKKQENVSLEPFFCLSCMNCLSKCFYSKKPVLSRKISGCAPVTFNIIFHPNFNPNIWDFANLPINRKFIHGNISLVFWKPKCFCFVLFWRRYKIVCTYKYLHLETLVGITFKKICIFIYKYWHYNLCYCYFDENKIYRYFIPLHCCKIPKGYSSNSSNISDYVNIVEITSTQHYTRIAYNMFPKQKMLEMIKWKQRVQKLRGFDVETT